MTLPASQPRQHTRPGVDGDLARRQEAVAECRPAARQAEHLAGDDARTMQQDQAMHRANELVFRIAPAHDFRDRQLAQRLRDDLGQVRSRVPRPAFAAGDKVLALAVGHLLQLRKADAGRAHEAFEGPGRLAGGVEGAGHRRALLFQHAVGLAPGNPGDGQRQTARCGVGCADAVRGSKLLRRQGGENASAKASDSTLSDFGGSSSVRSSIRRYRSSQCPPPPTLALHIGKPSAWRESW
jgi:hypothetical protein